MYRKRPRYRLPESDQTMRKLVAARASPGIVSIACHHASMKMIGKIPRYSKIMPPPKKYVFVACGMIIECQSSADGHYLCTLLAPASVFMQIKAVRLHETEIDVFIANAVLYKGKLLGYDYHYNLAAITIVSESPLPTVTLKGIHDILPFAPTDELPTHSNLFNILPGTQIFTLCRLHAHPYALLPGSGTFCSKFSNGLFRCNELYHIEPVEGSNYPEHDGGPVLNPFGEVIGIIFNKSSFLPSNIVSRWWNHYKSSGEFRRPFIGVAVANLHDADLEFLSHLVTTFPNISAGVVVTMVMNSSSGIHTNDVIVKLDGKLVRSKLEFYEVIWEKAGKAVEFNVLRVANGEELNLSLEIEEATPNKFYWWPHPNHKRLL